MKGFFMNQQKRKSRLRISLTLAMLVLLIAAMLVTAACNQSGGKDTGKLPDPTGDPETSEKDRVKAYDFALLDQHGVQHRLSEYEGKVIFLNFWATWCPPCQQELPDVEQLYKDYDLNSKELAVLGVVLPSGDKSPAGNRELPLEGVEAFITDHQLTFPVLMDTAGKVYEEYKITGMPTTFIIDHEGYFIGYVQGALSRELMDYYIDQAIEEMTG